MRDTETTTDKGEWRGRWLWPTVFCVSFWLVVDIATWCATGWPQLRRLYVWFAVLASLRLLLILDAYLSGGDKKQRLEELWQEMTQLVVTMLAFDFFYRTWHQ